MSYNNLIDSMLQEIDDSIENINVPEINVGIDKDDILSLEELSKTPNADLEHYLEVYGGYKSYLETQLAIVESKKGIIKSNFEELLAKELYQLSTQYTKRPTKEFLRGEALTKNKDLNDLRNELTKIESLYYRVAGLKDSYATAFFTVSRIITLREATRDQV